MDKRVYAPCEYSAPLCICSAMGEKTTPGVFGGRAICSLQYFSSGRDMDFWRKRINASHNAFFIVTSWITSICDYAKEAFFTIHHCCVFLVLIFQRRRCISFFGDSEFLFHYGASPREKIICSAPGDDGHICLICKHPTFVGGK